jgi:hypothetical protein
MLTHRKFQQLFRCGLNTEVFNTSIAKLSMQNGCVWKTFFQLKRLGQLC